MLRLYNTLTRSVDPVEPLEPGHVRMYSCGPTVYRPVHIGNLRTFMLADVLRRALRYRGLEVTAVMNITDVGHMTDEVGETGRDRMELAAEDEGRTPAEIADRYTQAFLRDCDAVGIERFDTYPKATEHIDAIVELTAKLLERGHAYEAGGTVYFDVGTFPTYGRLSRQSPDDMRAGHRVEVDPEKRNHQDFTLWRAAGPNRLMTWPSPWGPGYPGWHIECSAMSMHLLGPRFDIHTGGVDNVFPHHEDEIAQSEAATGAPVVSHWVHGEHLLLTGSKMAKSAGNVVTVETLREAGADPLAYRMLCFTARYRRQFHFDEDALGAAGTGLRRLREQVAQLGEGAIGAAETSDALRDVLTDPAALAHHDAFVAALDDDLDLPAAVRVVHEAMADAAVAPSDRRLLAASWDRVLALGLTDAAELPGRVRDLIDQRTAARSDGDFARADAIRDELRAEGIELLDGATGTSWVRRPG